MYRLLQAIIITLFLFTPAVFAATNSGRVTWIYDGDTIKVEKFGKVRLIGIDTPEYKNSSRDRFYTKKFDITPKQLRKIAKQAKRYNLDKVNGKRVELKFDQQNKDKYGRLLAYVYLTNGKMLNEILLEKGLAAVFRRYNFQHKKDFLKIEKRAQRRKLGLWKP